MPSRPSRQSKEGTRAAASDSGPVIDDERPKEGMRVDVGRMTERPAAHTRGPFVGRCVAICADRSVRTHPSGRAPASRIATNDATSASVHLVLPNTSSLNA